MSTLILGCTCWVCLTSSKFPLFLLSLCLSAALSAEQADPLPVCKNLPAEAEMLGEVAASSRRSSARTSSAKRNYIMREMQRQARLFGANALYLRRFKEVSEYKPQYGQRPGSMRYLEIVHLYGSGTALRLPDSLVRSEACSEDAPDKG